MYYLPSESKQLFCRLETKNKCPIKAANRISLVNVRIRKPTYSIGDAHAKYVMKCFYIGVHILHKVASSEVTFNSFGSQYYWEADEYEAICSGIWCGSWCIRLNLQWIVVALGKPPWWTMKKVMRFWLPLSWELIWYRGGLAHYD